MMADSAARRVEGAPSWCSPWVVAARAMSGHHQRLDGVKHGLERHVVNALALPRGRGEILAGDLRLDLERLKARGRIGVNRTLDHGQFIHEAVPYFVG